MVSRAIGRFALLACAAALASAAAAVPAVAAAGSGVLVPECGGTSYLSFKPSLVSAGCTSGSPTIEAIDWQRYGAREAVGTGTALVQDCGCYDPTAFARYPARIVVSTPRQCREGRGGRYFSKVRLTVTYPPENPFGKPAGADSGSWHVPRGRCEFAPLPAQRRAPAGPRYFMSCGYPPVYDSEFNDYFDGHIEYRSHPRACPWSENGSTSTQIILEKLRWRGWGTPRAHARALRVDNHDMDNNGFQRHRVRVTVFAPRPAVGHSGARRLYYTKIRISENGHSGVENLFRPGEPAVSLYRYRPLAAAAGDDAVAARRAGEFFVPTGRRAGFGAFRDRGPSAAALRAAFGPPAAIDRPSEYSCEMKWPQLGAVATLTAFGTAGDACSEGTFVSARLTDPRWHTASGVRPGGPTSAARRASVRRCHGSTLGCSVTGYALELHRTDCAASLSAGVIAHVRGRRVASLNVYWRACE